MDPHALLIDADHLNLRRVRRTLEAAGWSVSTTSDLQEAVALASSRTPALVLIDASPHIEHPEVSIAWLRICCGPDLPIVAMSPVFSTLLARAVPRSHFLKKPVEPRELWRVVSHVLEPQREGSMPNQILIIDDDDPTRELITLVLEQEGWSVRGAANAQRLLADRPVAEAPSLALLDMHIPQVSAEEASAMLRTAYGPNLPIIALSASQERARAAAIGACAFVDKPFDLDRLTDVVRRSMALAAAVAEKADAAADLMNDVQQLRDASHSALDRLHTARSKASLTAGRLRSSIKALEAALGPTTTLARALDTIRSGVSASAGAVMRAEGHSARLVASSGFPADLVDLWAQLPLDSSLPIGDAIRGTAVWLPSLSSGLDRYPNLAGGMRTISEDGALCALPARLAGGGSAAVELVFPQPRDFAADDRRAIERLVGALSPHLT